MTGEKIDFDEVAAQAAVNEKGYERSTIAFPYLDLDSAVDVTRAIYNRAGRGACNLDELAAEMSHTLSGAFRLKTGTARTFGLTEKEGRDSIRLTDLGLRLLSPDGERSARVEAFLSVPLYSAIYEKYRGHLLPPAKALEREMQTLGVSPKQTDKARQAFERSARQAAFYEAGDDRLVKPRLDNSTLPVETHDTRANSSSVEPADAKEGKLGKIGGGSGGAGGDLNLDPLLVELLKKIPPVGESWPVNHRLRWFKTFAMNVSQIYDADEDPIDLAISVSSNHSSS